VISSSRVRIAVLSALAVAAVGAWTSRPASAHPVAAPATTTPAPRAAKKWVVNMGSSASMFVFEPKAITIQVGDTVKWVATAGSHNVSFWADSIPTGAADLLRKLLPDTLAAGATGYFTLTTSRKPTMGDSIVVVFAGVPKGVYKYNCRPHLMRGMVGMITVQ
jgi:plastocyanin